MNYHLFLPGAQSGTQCIEEFGLTDLYADGNPVMMPLIGPTGEHGVLLNYVKQNPDSDAQTQYFADWDWRPIGKYWIGINPKSPPTPADLIRRERVPGFSMDLLDGNSWMFPVYSRVEHAYGIDDDGNMVKVPADKHAQFFQQCLSVQRLIFEAIGLLDLLDDLPDKELDATAFPDKQIPVTVADGARLVCNALQINYRINFEIALALKLLNDPLSGQIIANMIEMPEIVACQGQKKNRHSDVIIPVGYDTEKS